MGTVTLNSGGLEALARYGSGAAVAAQRLRWHLAEHVPVVARESGRVSEAVCDRDRRDARGRRVSGDQGTVGGLERSMSHERLGRDPVGLTKGGLEFALGHTDAAAQREHREMPLTG